MARRPLFKPSPDELAEHYPTRAEHLADFVVHGIGFFAAAFGGGVLFALAMHARGASLATAAAFYALCLIVMLACSAAYNLTRPSAARRILRRLDEASIFFLIAGSYTPFTMGLLDGGADVAVTVGVWALALAGAAAKIFLDRISDSDWCKIYMAFGWLAVVLMIPLAGRMPMLAIFLLAVGGLIYSGGVLVYLRHSLPYRRAIWHAIVLLGAGAHYGAVLTGVVLA
jgi:hemolysin III